MQVLETIKHTMHVNLQLENARSIVNLLFCLRNKNGGTGDVEIGCRKLCARMKCKTRGFVRRIMRWHKV